MIDINIFLEAAEAVETEKEEYSCCAVSRRSGEWCGAERVFYSSLFNLYPEYLGETGFYKLSPEERKHLRVMMLCMAAAVAESEGE